MTASVPESRYKELANERGYIFVGGYTGSTKSRVTWRCDKGHEWDAAYGNIVTGHGCPYCAGKARKRSKDYRALASEKGIEWLGPLPKNNRKKSKWRCQEGHEWLASYSSTYSNGNCPHCSGVAPKVEQDYHDLARKHGFEFVGPFPKTTKHKTKWRCPEGHVWRCHFNNIYLGRGCPACRDANRSGENHPRWNPDKTEEERLMARQYKEYYEWRVRVFERDGYACQICGDDKGGNLRAHHLNSYTDHEGQRTEDDNGVTLCEPCHIAYHSKYGWSGSCAEDFVEFAASHGIHFLTL